MSIYRRLAEIEEAGINAALATVIHARGSVPRHAGTKMIIYADGSFEGTIGGGKLEDEVIKAARTAIQSGKSELLKYKFQDPEQGDVGVCGGEMEVFVEPLKSARTLIVIGAGHVGRAVAHLGQWLGFHVIVSDDREGFAIPEQVPSADEYFTCEMGDLPGKLSIGPQTYIVLTTRGVTIDAEGLPALLESQAAYIGVIGSRRRWETTKSELRAKGMETGKLERVHSPTGLELHAETPQEIAVSILAEIIMQMRGGSGETMADHAHKRRKG
jgi:xanthine dehydrogenase accessory factor